MQRGRQAGAGRLGECATPAVLLQSSLAVEPAGSQAWAAGPTIARGRRRQGGAVAARRHYMTESLQLLQLWVSASPLHALPSSIHPLQYLSIVPVVTVPLSSVNPCLGPRLPPCTHMRTRQLHTPFLLLLCILPLTPAQPCPLPILPWLQFWPLVAHKVVGCQLIMVVFTASVLLFKVCLWVGGRAGCASMACSKGRAAGRHGRDGSHAFSVACMIRHNSASAGLVPPPHARAQLAHLMCKHAVVSCRVGTPRLRCCTSSGPSSCCGLTSEILCCSLAGPCCPAA